jgi:hypothetical protein
VLFFQFWVIFVQIATRACHNAQAMFMFM